ncbi:MAG: hypothetical protein RLP44_16035 [Aggregatilineales bacterium]
MNMRKWFGLMLVLMLAFVLAACGGDSDDDNDSDGDSSSASSADLSQSITAEDPNFGGSLTVNYPEGWVATDSGGVISLAESQATLDLAQNATDTAPALEENTVFVSITPLAPELVSIFIEEGQTATPAILLDATILAGGTDTLDVQPVEITDINGKSGATVSAVSTNADEPGRLFAVAVAVDNGYVIVTAITNPDETDFDDTVRAIAGAVEATFPVAEEATEEPAG